jgi:predicted ATPase
MSGLLDPDDIQALRRATLGVTPQRMLREIATALEVFTAARPLVLVLEDLHWSDDATLHVLSALARRQEPARFLLLGTYRSEEVKGQKSLLYAIVQDLRLRKSCEALQLSALSEAAIRTYLQARLPETCLASGVVRFVVRHTEGNPLFMVAMREHLLTRGLAGQGHITWTEDAEAAIGLPDTLRQLLEQQFERLSPEAQEVLEVGSIAGNAFTAGKTIGHLMHGIDLVNALPETPEYIRLELKLLIALGQALIAVKGNAAPEVQRVYDRARTLSQQVGDTSRLFQVWFGLARHDLVRRGLDAARRAARRCLQLAQKQYNLMLQIKAHAMLGVISLFRAEFAAAHEYLGDHVVQPLAQSYHPTPLDPDPDPVVHCDSFAGVNGWILGYPEQALQQTLRGIR